MKIPGWLPRLPFGQYGTWVGHAAATLYPAASVGRSYPFAGGSRLLTVCVVATLILLLYIRKEQGDKAMHLAKGDYYEHMSSTGHMTGETDHWGDSLGPWVVTVTCWTLFLVSL